MKTKITEELLLKLGFIETNNSHHELNISEKNDWVNRSLTISKTYRDLEDFHYTLDIEQMGDRLSIVNITFNLEYIEDLEEFIRICRL